MFLVVRIWGGVTDLVADRRVDETSTRWARFRSYLLFALVPLAALLVAMFSIPSGLGADGKLAWAYASYALFQLAYSFVNVPYGSLTAVMTQEPDERAKLPTGRVIASSPAILLIAVVVSPQVSGLGRQQKSLTITTIALALVGFALYVWCFGRERSCEDLPVGSYVPITTPVVETLLSASFSPGGPL